MNVSPIEKTHFDTTAPAEGKEKHQARLSHSIRPKASEKSGKEERERRIRSLSSSAAAIPYAVAKNRLGTGSKEESSPKYIEESGLSGEKKMVYLEAHNTLKDYLKKKEDLPFIHLMEGATGETSTDPDENIALLAASLLAKWTSIPQVFVIPNGRKNLDATLSFLRHSNLSFVKEFEEDTVIEPSLVYVVPMEDEKLMQALAHATEKGRHLCLLGPATSSAPLELLKDGKARTLTVMGKYQEDGKGGFVTSTNTRSSESKLLIERAKELRVQTEFFPSDTMGKQTLSISDVRALNKSPLICNEKDVSHWAQNVEEQFSGAFSANEAKKDLPASMLFKRLNNALKKYPKIANLLIEGPSQKTMQAIKETIYLSFESLLTSVQGNCNPSVLVEEIIDDLAVSFLLDWKREDALKSYLGAHFKAFSEEKYPKHIEASKRLICKLDALSLNELQSLTLLILAAFRDTYEEKCPGAWNRITTEQKDPWSFESFKRGFYTDGRVVPYDALVVYTAVLGRDIHVNDSMSEKEQRKAANEVACLVSMRP